MKAHIPMHSQIPSTLTHIHTYTDSHLHSHSHSHIHIRVSLRTQVDGMIEFAQGTSGLMLTWDQQIEASCKTVNQVLQQINKNHGGKYEV